MDEGLAGFLIFIAIGILTSIICHYANTRYFVASLIADAVTNLIFHAVAYIHAGYLEPFFEIALFFSSLAGLALALIVGLPFLMYRRRRSQQQPTTQA